MMSTSRAASRERSTKHSDTVGQRLPRHSSALTDTWHLPLGAFLLAVVFVAPRGLAALFSRPVR